MFTLKMTPFDVLKCSSTSFEALDRTLAASKLNHTPSSLGLLCRVARLMLRCVDCAIRQRLQDLYALRWDDYLQHFRAYDFAMIVL